MKWQPKTFVYALVGGVVAMLSLATGNHMLNGDRPNAWVIAGFSCGFLVAVAAIVPLLVRGFLRAQIAIGHGEVPALRFLREHERALSYAVWSLFALGFCLAIPTLIHEASCATPAAVAAPER